jgi:predicted house-cleaning noncanonical NTP pyrophosphatase (MazG superfamily)
VRGPSGEREQVIVRFPGLATFIPRGVSTILFAPDRCNFPFMHAKRSSSSSPPSLSPCYNILMPRITYNKLIRDSIPEIITADNAIPKISILSDTQFTLALKQKVVEEAMELLETKSRDDVLNELSDILELVETILLDHKITKEEIEEKKLSKRNKRGGFTERLFLEYVDEEEKNNKA